MNFFKTILVMTLTVLIMGCGYKETISVISGSENKTLEPLIEKFQRESGIGVEMHYKGSVDIMMELQKPAMEYDAVWPANSLWISLGDTQRKVKHAESILTSPVVFGIRKSLAESLGFASKEVRVSDIYEAINAGKLKFMMTSATQSNSGASAYFGFLYALAGNPDVLTMGHLQDAQLKNDITNLLGGVNRSSGSSGWLKELFLESDYDAMVNYEAMIIEANQELVKMGKEPLYVVYPVDGLVIADSPLGFVPSGDSAQEKAFLKFQKYLLSTDVQDELANMGRRTGFGGVPDNVNPEVFNKAWGIRIDQILSPFKLPEGVVIQEALNLYQTEFRKPSLTVFCLDYSGSMAGNGEAQLKESIRLLLDQNTARQYYIQTGVNDVIVVIPFSDKILDTWIIEGNNTQKLRDVTRLVEDFYPGGGTDIYSPVMTSLSVISKRYNLEDYIPAVILMTDGESNTGSTFHDLESYLRKNNLDIPVFSILFGNAKEQQLEEIAELTRARVFDGKHNLVSAFRKAKGYN